MITEDTLLFPQNVVAVLSNASALLDPDLSIFRRPLRDTDPVQSIGIFAAQWYPQEDSYEMRGGLAGPSEPTIDRYTITIQALVKDADEQRGLAVHSVLGKLVRTMLYRNPALRVGLSSLVTTTGESTERVTRWGVQTQRFHSNEISGSWLYLSTLEFWVETQTT